MFSSACPPGRVASKPYPEVRPGLCVTPAFNCEGDFLGMKCCKYNNKQSILIYNVETNVVEVKTIKLIADATFQTFSCREITAM